MNEMNETFNERYICMKLSCLPHVGVHMHMRVHMCGGHPRTTPTHLPPEPQWAWNTKIQ